MTLRRSRPFTLLILLSAGWVAARLSVPGLMPMAVDGASTTAARPLRTEVSSQLASADAPWRNEARHLSPLRTAPPLRGHTTSRGYPPMLIRMAAVVASPPAVPGPVTAQPPLLAPGALPPPDPGRTLASPQSAPAPRPDRFTLSAWLLARNGNGAPALSGQAALGGSQAGVRAGWRLDRGGRVEAFARLSSAGHQGDGAEGALGIAFRPHPRLPLQLVAERRQALAGDEGRSAFAAYAVGGVDSLRAGPVLVDAYGAAGMVGSASRDLFAEGSAVARLPIARLGPADLSAGGGLWAAAQPGASRVDVGPRAQLRWREGPVRPVVSLDWRQRVASDARPRSGPALTVGVDF